jgi:hypothetical protein
MRINLILCGILAMAGLAGCASNPNVQLYQGYGGIAAGASTTTGLLTATPPLCSVNTAIGLDTDLKSGKVVLDQANIASQATGGSATALAWLNVFNTILTTATTDIQAAESQNTPLQAKVAARRLSRRATAPNATMAAATVDWTTILLDIGEPLAIQIIDDFINSASATQAQVTAEQGIAATSLSTLDAAITAAGGTPPPYPPVPVTPAVPTTQP